MIKVIYGVVLCVAAARCEPPVPHYGPPISSYGTPNYNADFNHEHSAPKSYEFGYQVKDDYTGNNYNRQETSDGNQVNGEYRVHLPDGRIQIVTYYADWQTGFHADVRYEGTASYPEDYGHRQYGPPGYGGSGNSPATSSVSIKDYSGPATPYNAGGGGYANNYHGGYDSYANPDNYAPRTGPPPTYGAP
ncbi:pro-resilin-like [Photinus pyralis]|uniref:pro-resilin-like n=1 Tax=Photinus pyralis TaxID=7054 RepID=UPI00126771FB|nr:pro-resilin-like [Photinus pyralis]